MRLSELANLTLADIELPKRITRDIESMGSVRVHRKGGKVERIPLNYKACQALHYPCTFDPYYAANRSKSVCGGTPARN